MKNLKATVLVTALAVFALSSCEKQVVVPTEDMTSSAATTQSATTDSNVVAETAQEDLPQKVTAFLTEHYPTIKISKYEIKTIMGGKKYEVKLNNGVEVEFDKDENWTEIKDYNGVPDMLVPAKVKTYVNQNYKDIKIKSLEKNPDKNKMDVDLLNGVDLDFDMDGNFLKID